MTALRCSRRLAYVLRLIKIELLFALGAAEVIRLPLVLGSSSGGSRFYVHAAHRIFHSCCVLHYHLSSVREFWLDGSSNVDWPVSDRITLISICPIFQLKPLICTAIFTAITLVP